MPLPVGVRRLIETNVKTSTPRRIDFQGADELRIVGDAFGDAGAPTVLLLHGGGQTRHSWHGTARALAHNGWQAISVDLRGHGDSAWAPNGDYRHEAFAGDILRIVDTLGQPPVVVGASLGGLAALTAEGLRPEPVSRALVLVDVGPRIEEKGAARIVGFMLAQPNGFASLDEAAEAVTAYNPHRPRPKDTSGLRKNLREGTDGRWRWHWDPAFLSAGRRHDDRQERLDAAARGLRVPALIVRGRQSDLLSEDGVRHFLDLVPHARFADVSGAGHMVAGDRNDAFTTAVLDFLGTLV